MFVHGEPRFVARLGPCKGLRGDSVRCIIGLAELHVITAGRQQMVLRFIELAAQPLGSGGGHATAFQWNDSGIGEVGRRADTGKVVVRIAPRYLRPAEVETLLGDPTKVKDKLGWTMTTTLEELAAETVAMDKEEAANEALLCRLGFEVVGPMKNPPSSAGASLCCRARIRLAEGFESTGADFLNGTLTRM